MKNDTVTTTLNVLLGALVVLGVVYALLTMFRIRELRSLHDQAAYASNALGKIQALANDTAAYNQKKSDPQITRLLESIEAKPVAK